MPEANAEGMLEKSVITTILNILTKTTSFRSEHQLCEVMSREAKQKFFLLNTFPFQRYRGGQIKK